MVIVDFSQIMYASLFAMGKGNAVVDEGLVRHIVLNTLRAVKVAYGNKYGRMILCMDSSNPWRNDVYEYYKAKRKEKREERDDPKLDAMFSLMKDIQKELDEQGPYPVLKVDRCEADDIIAVVARELESQEIPCLIVSNDKDFYQLHSDYIQQYHNRNGEKQVTQFENPDVLLHELIARGDSTDGVPNVLSDDDVFVNDGKRQKPLTKKKLNPIVEALDPDNPFITVDDLDTVVKRNIDRNKKLVDLSEIPAKYQKSILETLIDQSEETYSHSDRGMRLYNYLLSHDAKLLAEDVHEFMIGEHKKDE